MGCDGVIFELHGDPMKSVFFIISSILEILIECFELLLESPSEILSDFYGFAYFKLFNMLSTIQIIF